jgi:ribosomal protein S16
MLQRTPFYYILAADSKFKPTGRHLENLGTYDPIPGMASMNLNVAYAVHFQGCCFCASRVPG